MTKTGTSDHRILTQRARAAHLAGKVIDERILRMATIKRCEGSV